MDPTPSKDGAKNEHGTRCAGEIAAERNDFCGIGAAYEAGISGIKVLDGKMTDSMEATAFHMKLDVNDVYSCSWGPEDDGATIDGPHHLTSMAMEYGVTNGRRGYGAIYVVASGNGGITGDNCNFDGYANSVYTVTIGAVDEYGHIPYYAEECAAMLAVSLSSGGRGDRSIITTDWTEVDGTGCTREHTGTSAAAPLAAAVIALMLQVRSCLTWRDVQYLIVITSQQINKDFSDWYKNAAGLLHSHHHGFGMLSAWNLVSAAKMWRSVPWMSIFSTGPLYVEKIILAHPNRTFLKYNVTEEAIRPYFIWIMEYVRIRISLTHSRRGQLDLRLICPSGSESVLSKPRANDKSSEGFNDWIFTTVRCWGEKPTGEWTFVVTDFDNNNASRGTITKWELIIMGTPITPNEFQSRIRLAREAANSTVLDDLNFTIPCRPPQKRLGDDVKGISEKILQIICFSGVFLFLLAVFETVEYMLCYDDEKKKFKELLSSRFGKSNRNRDDSECTESIPLISSNGETENNDLEGDELDEIETNSFDEQHSPNRNTTNLYVERTLLTGLENDNQVRRAPSNENLLLI
ncbi:Proprotein convertase subtilisin/kexin type 7, variant 2 [Chamberlinius hualienensis]